MCRVYGKGDLRFYRLCYAHKEFTGWRFYTLRDYLPHVPKAAIRNGEGELRKDKKEGKSGDFRAARKVQ